MIIINVNVSDVISLQYCHIGQTNKTAK
uniref:Uncharacterized protein n=1 Tax=Anguilla anguilla TaxID=7936 RepID=A0A0E9VQR8_ANGAN